MAVEEKRVSRQAREMEDLMATAVVMITTLIAVAEVNIMSICYSFVEIRILTMIWGVKVRL